MSARPQPPARPPRPVSRPKVPLPAGAWECHCHVFGPFSRFPVIDDRRYEPPEAPVESYLAMLDTVGFENGVIVHASAKGHDMRNVADALARRPGRLVGVAVPPSDADEKTIAALHEQGFRGIRFTETGMHAGRSPGTLYFDDLARLAPIMRQFGWHAQVWGRCDLIMASAAVVDATGLPVVFDHLGTPDAARGPDDAVFRSFLAWIATGDYWVKTTPVRVSKAAPDYPDARPIYEALLRAVPDRLLFGADWPYISLDDAPPDVGHMVDLLDSWTGDETLRRRIFVDNPVAFYRR
jgi:2-pyrone-4,6-dicarboxylate lactonase